MGKRQRRRARSEGQEAAEPARAVEYADPEGNVLGLREELSEATRRKIARLDSTPGASGEDLHRRRAEMLFERLAVRWVIAGLPLEGQAELLGRYRMAGGEERAWVDRTVAGHAAERWPDL